MIKSYETLRIHLECLKFFLPYKPLFLRSPPPPVLKIDPELRSDSKLTSSSQEPSGHSLEQTEQDRVLASLENQVTHTSVTTLYKYIHVCLDSTRTHVMSVCVTYIVVEGEQSHAKST